MSNQVTEQQLAEWERLAGAATAGPWRVTDYENVMRADGRHIAFDDSDDGACVRESDAAFIAASREAVPRLVAALREARAETKALRDWYREHVGGKRLGDPSDDARGLSGFHTVSELPDTDELGPRIDAALGSRE